jgi:hypothetical protein
MSIRQEYIVVVIYTALNMPIQVEETFKRVRDWRTCDEVKMVPSNHDSLRSKGTVAL